MNIILASSSKVRKKVLDNLGISYTSCFSKFEEKTELGENESFEDLAKRLALGKAREVARGIKSGMVISADSFAVFKGKILGKPKTIEKAVKYLKKLSGKKHQFFTGMAVIDVKRRKELTSCARALVYFRSLSPQEITEYVEKESDVTEAAAAYRIQSLGSFLVNKIEGDYYAVVGFSPSKLQEMLRSLNYNLFDYISPLGSK